MRGIGVSTVLYFISHLSFAKHDLDVFCDLNNRCEVYYVTIHDLLRLLH